MKKNNKNKNIEKVEVKEVNNTSKEITKDKPVTNKVVKEVKKTEKNPVVKLQEDIDKNIVEASKVEAVTKVPFYKRWFLLKSIYEGFKRWFIK